MSSVRRFVETFFAYFEKSFVPYCILHSYETLPEHASSDIDIAVDLEQKQNLDALIIRTASETGFIIVQKLYYDVPACFYYVLAGNNAEGTSVVQLDFLIDSIGINRYLLTSSELLAERAKYKNFYIPSHGMQAVYLLIKKTIKNKFLEKHFYKLKELYIQKPLEVSNTIDKYLSSKIRKEVIAAIDGKSGDELAVLVPDINSVIKKKYVSKNILKFLWEIKRILFRFLNPTGLLVVVLSPDGGGKSSMCKSILEKLLGLFRKTNYFHWRPGVLPQIRTLFGKSKLESEFVFSNPHSPKKRSKITSFFRWLYYTLDYFIGYYLKIFPMKIKTTAIVMDRYYYDIIVDPIRYGFNLPQWLLKLPLKIIPKPDLTIYLDNEPEELYKRKQELPVEELRRQVNAWRKFIPSLPNARIVTTDKPLEDVVNEVTRLVLERRAELTRKMLKVDPDESRYLWKSDITGYIALPSKKNCRWIIPINPKLARKAWDLYQPYSLFGRIYKSTMSSLSGYGSLRLLKHINLSLEFSDSEQASLFMKCITDVFGKEDIALAISTGTPSPFRKITAMIMDSKGNVLGFAKIGETPLAIQRIKRETKILILIAHSSLLIAQKSSAKSHQLSAISIRVPEILYEGEIGNGYMLIQSPAPFEGKSGSRYFNDDYANVLRILIDNTSVKKKFIESEFYKILKSGIDNYMLSYRELLKQGLDYLERNIGDKEIIFTLSHGDFAPWNMLWSKNRKEVFIFDWESANSEAPAGIDLVHFLFQTGFLLKKLRGRKLLSYIILNPFLSEYSFLSPDDLILSYCLYMTVTEDLPQQLSQSAIQRRQMIKTLVGRGYTPIPQIILKK